ALSTQLPSLANIQRLGWASQLLALPSRTFQSCLGSLRNANAFLLGDSSQNADDCLAERTQRVNVLLSVALESNPQMGKPLKVGEGLKRAFPCQAVKGPEQQHLEAVPSGLIPHATEAGAIAIARRGLVPVFANNAPTLLLGKAAQSNQLVAHVLATIGGRDAQVERSA